MREKRLRALLGTVGLLTCSAFGGTAAFAATGSPSQTSNSLSAISTTGTSTSADLTANANIQISALGPDGAFAQSESAYNTPLCGSSAWHGFLRQSARDITIDLGANHQLSSISIQMEQEPSLGVYLPNQVDFQVYRNGQWYDIGSLHPAVPATNIVNNVQTFSINASGIAAQKVRIHFPVDVWVFARNVSVQGSAAIAKGTVIPSTLSPIPAQSTAPMLATSTSAHGIHNMLLVYTDGATANESVWTPSDFLPMVAHQQSDGTVNGQMFDSFLFLPYSSLADTQSGWQGYLNDLFARGTQLDALNTAVGQANQALKTPGHKVNVVLTLPYPKFGDGDWGTIAGQTINFSGSTGDPVARGARDEAMSWYLTLLMNDWNSAGFSNLKLNGIYWDNELVDYSAPGEEQIVRDAVNNVHQENLPMFWIPFYDASGLDSWKSFGFDAAWLQSNYVEQANPNLSRLTSAEKLAGTYGLGMELEVSAGSITPQAATFYENTLNQLTQDEFGGGVSHAFYAGSKGLVQAAQSSEAYMRTLYDDTYQFIQNTNVK